MVIEIYSTKSEEKILVLTATDHYDRQILEEIVKTEAYISAKHDPRAHITFEVSIPLIKTERR